MRLPILFLTFIWFCLWIGARFRINRRKSESRDQAFWDKEREANFARAKPLDDLAYITVDVDMLPFQRIPEGFPATDAVDKVRALAEEKIVNLTGISNTDLKLQYGATNLETLSHYDQNFTALVTALQKWAHTLIDLSASPEEGQTDTLLSDARTVLTYAVSIGTDIAASYRDLADLAERTLPEAEAQAEIAQLLEKAQALNSLTKPQLVADLTGRLAP